MLAASLPPLPAGGAEMQALLLGEALGRKDLSVCFITPGKGNAGAGAGTVAGTGTGTVPGIKGMPVFRLNSWINRLFGWLSGIKKKQRQSPTRIEYDDRTETTRQIGTRVGWPTVVYYNIFFFHSLLFLWRRRRSFDIIHAHTMEWSAIVAARLGKILGKPVLIKDSTMNGFASLARFPSGARLQKMIIGQAHFVAMTKIIRENLQAAGVPADKISLIPNGINITEPPLRSPKEEDGPRVLFVGNLYQQPAKGVDILLKAWTHVAREYPRALLQIVGDGDLPAYMEYAESLHIGSSVHFYGRQSGLTAWYGRATLFVLPSRREGMSNALMEAMLHELPCIATDISGSQDLLVSGVNGLLVPSAEAGRLADAICYMLSHPREAIEMGKKARETILRKTDIGLVAAEYISLYKKLMTGLRN
jgi:glycosyltransferase involved in cell wall biosynthesis